MNSGRPPIYSDVSEIIPKLEDWEKKIIAGEKPTVTGLCLALDFESKDTLYNYSRKDEFSYPIKRALLIVENGYESALRENNATGSIFALKNMGWKDQSAIDHTTGGDKVNTNIINVKELPDDILRQIVNNVNRPEGVSE